jgi:hypothetical protein
MKNMAEGNEKGMKRECKIGMKRNEKSARNK